MHTDRVGPTTSSISVLPTLKIMHQRQVYISDIFNVSSACVYQHPPRLRRGTVSVSGILVPTTNTIIPAFSMTCRSKMINIRCFASTTFLFHQSGVKMHRSRAFEVTCVVRVGHESLEYQLGSSQRCIFGGTPFRSLCNAALHDDHVLCHQQHDQS